MHVATLGAAARHRLLLHRPITAAHYEAQHVSAVQELKRELASSRSSAAITAPPPSDDAAAPMHILSFHRYSFRLLFSTHVLTSLHLYEAFALQKVLVSW